MPNYNQLIINSKTCSIQLIVPTATGPKPFPLLTVQSFDFNASASGELVYAIGTPDPIGNQSNENKYDGKITLQLGEINAILLICGFTAATQIQNAQISVAGLTGGFVRVYKSANCNSDTTSLTAKSNETLTTLDWLAMSVGP